LSIKLSTIDDSGDQPPKPSAFLGLAFRPLFFLGAAFSCLSMVLWLLFLHGYLQPPSYTTPFLWHGHEMLFGFVTAIVVGFLLTAVQNWTGIKGLNGKPLLLLISVWLAARLSMSVDIPVPFIEWIDILFLPLAAFLLARPIIAIKQTRNLMFIPVLVLMSLANIVFHYGVYLSDLLLSQQALQAMLWLTVLLITLLGGRVIPFFTANGTQKPRAIDRPWLEIVVIASTIMVAGVQGLGLSNHLSANSNSALLIIAAVFQGWRFCRWRFWTTGRVPLLWSLHAAYAFIPLGMVLIAASYWLDDLTLSTARHSILVGAIGAMILSMMARVSLGHTGRALNPHKIMSLAFLLIIVAGLLRSLGVWLASEIDLLSLAAIGWILAYLIFALAYWPVLSRARIDGKAG